MNAQPEAVCKRCGGPLHTLLDKMRLLCDSCFQQRRAPNPPPDCIPYPADEEARDAAGCCGSIPACPACPFWED